MAALADEGASLDRTLGRQCSRIPSRQIGGATRFGGRSNVTDVNFGTDAETTLASGVARSFLFDTALWEDGIRLILLPRIEDANILPSFFGLRHATNRSRHQQVAARFNAWSRALCTVILPLERPYSPESEKHRLHLCPFGETSLSGSQDALMLNITVTLPSSVSAPRSSVVTRP
ncbi:hypothetical protein FB45DRAFT_1041103 [Roridomyces roridus]|uniref:Uncharacterized protein n=1 Tax=Roridomyces roridus TaxID=1738132 RepID=A0AAD7B0N6_9AGAR|nr:hypothetical protein FB45DRAFT_1041103 [Roridomyces roridus]